MDPTAPQTASTRCAGTCSCAGVWAVQTRDEHGSEQVLRRHWKCQIMVNQQCVLCYTSAMQGSKDKSTHVNLNLSQPTCKPKNDRITKAF